VIVKFIVNNKTYSATQVSLFIVNYGRELRMRVDIRRKGKVEKVINFIKRMREVQEEVEAALKKAQEKIKQQADKRRREVEKWKKSSKIILNMCYMSSPPIQKMSLQ